jgi:NADH:ubiquinone oxidoreductase subunit D
VPIGSKGDSYDRYLIRIEEMRQSGNIILQSINLINQGPVNTKDFQMNFNKQDFKYDMEKLILHFKRFGKGFKIKKGSVYKNSKFSFWRFNTFINRSFFYFKTFSKSFKM